MNIEYDVKVPMPRQRPDGFAAAFKDFYESGHYNAKIEYDDVGTAKRAQKAMCMVREYIGIMDVVITRQQHVLYLVRENRT